MALIPSSNTRGKGTIGIMAGTTTGIEPLFAVAYKRRYLKGTEWHFQYVVDSAAEELIERYGVDPESIESALDLAQDYKRRIKFQADVQDFVDQSISGTINLPSWGTDLNNEDTVKPFAETLACYARFPPVKAALQGGLDIALVDHS